MARSVCQSSNHLQCMCEDKICLDNVIFAYFVYIGLVVTETGQCEGNIYYKSLSFLK